MKNRTILFLLLLASSFGGRPLSGMDTTPTAQRLCRREGLCDDVWGVIFSFSVFRDFLSLKICSRSFKKIA